ncbi:START domain-containing protein, partial [uncultured Pseudoalteromonas sp.]
MQKCISLLIILLSFNTYSEPRWQLYKNEQGVNIEYQQFSNDTFIVKGQLNIEDVTANDFLDLLSDTRIASSWLENTSKVRVIKALSPSENLVYSYIDSPWPVANRDAVTYSC